MGQVLAPGIKSDSGEYVDAAQMRYSDVSAVLSSH